MGDLRVTVWKALSLLSSREAVAQSKDGLRERKGSQEQGVLEGFSEKLKLTKKICRPLKRTWQSSAKLGQMEARLLNYRLPLKWPSRDNAGKLYSRMSAMLFTPTAFPKSF